MDRNPYAPPDAPVADVPARPAVPEEVSTARPTQVLWTVWLSVISAIWELASDELEGRGFVSGVMSRTDTIIELIGLGIVLAVGSLAEWLVEVGIAIARGAPLRGFASASTIAFGLSSSLGKAAAAFNAIHWKPRGLS